MAAPFTMSYVLGVTYDQMIKAVEFSLSKTLARSREPGLSDEVNKEIVLTIQKLINLRQRLMAERQQ